MSNPTSPTASDTCWSVMQKSLDMRPSCLPANPPTKRSTASGSPTYPTSSVHRIAVSRDVKGKGYGLLLLQTIADYARSLGIGSFRIDTNFDNSAMLGLLDRLGFTYCGDVEYQQGSRMAFEKLL